MTTIAANLQAVRARIAAACLAANRPVASVTLLAVSKTWPADCVRDAIRAGQTAFGENYVQEGVAKYLTLCADTPPAALDWHYIGPLQSNKTKAVADHFAWVHTIDRLKIAQRLSEQRPADSPPLQVCVQVNVSGEVSKSGCDPQQALDLALAVAALPRLRLRGLMAIPAPSEDTSLQRAQFALLRASLEHINQRSGLALDTLSMGMSHDLEAAIMEGSTLVRIGTAIFGQRDYTS